MKRTNLTLIELLLAAIFLVIAVPVVTSWSEDAGGVTRLKKVEKETAERNRAAYTGQR